MDKNKVRKISLPIEINKDFEDPLFTKAKIVNMIFSYSQEFIVEKDVSRIKKLEKIYYEEMEGARVSINGLKAPILKPVEKLGSYSIPDVSNIVEEYSIREANKWLGEYGIGAYDSSWHRGGAHFLADYLIFNTGYFYYNYGVNEGGSGSHPIILLGRIDDMDPDLEGKSHETNVGLKLSDKLFGKHKVLLMDESMNYIYTIKWSKDKRVTLVNMMKEFFDKLISHGVVPLGVFYTRARDIARTLEYAGYDIGDAYIQDKHLFNQILENGERSPVFKVINPILVESDLDISCFYLKLGPANVVRIEFPSKILSDKGVIEVVHKAVLLQSILGGGYPYAMTRAHEMSVLSVNDRMDIEASIAKILNIPLEYLYSRKQMSKWRSIA